MHTRSRAATIALGTLLAMAPPFAGLAQSPAVPADLTQRISNFGTLMGLGLRCGRPMADAAALSEAVYAIIDEEVTANADREELRETYMAEATNAYRAGNSSAGGPDCVPVWLEFDATLDRLVGN
jgi:hypothetical protein